MVCHQVEHQYTITTIDGMNRKRVAVYASVFVSLAAPCQHVVSNGSEGVDSTTPFDCQGQSNDTVAIRGIEGVKPYRSGGGVGRPMPCVTITSVL